jgi:hypothetical protein
LHVGLFCNLAKAFDTINHDITTEIEVLWNLGKAGQWFKLCLNGRKRVEVKSESRIKHFETGSL